MVGIATWAKLKVLNSILNSCDEEQIASVIATFGERQFGKDLDKYIEAIQRELTGVIMKLNKYRR